MRRMFRSAARAALPTFDIKECLECIKELIRVDSDWVPYSTSASLYVRPTMIGTDVSPFEERFNFVGQGSIARCS